MPSFHHGLISRSSSATLSVSHPQEIRDGSFEDMAIAQELLNQPRISRSQTTLTGFLSDPQGLQQSHSQIEYDGSKDGKRSRRALRTSNTWTSSSGEVLSDHDEIEDRTLFVAEYNRLAQKHGVRVIVPDDFEANDETTNASGKSGSWFTRKILRRTSSSQSAKPDKHMRHRRSISDLSLRLKNAKKDSLKDKDLEELVRLCGLSLLYLPAEYAAGSLAVPTCFRATAQYLVQHAPPARGVFRIPGSHHVVAALYNHYCNKDVDGDFIAGTVRCPTVPEHIKCDVHDVASAFKKFLSGLPGGILGSLTLFDALISIQSQLQGDPELTRTKQSKVRARLIALAISTLRSQYRRDLICAVFGLLCMIGRAAETTRREDDKGRPLPTSDLMGYGALGIVFGPLLIGELLGNYTMHLANPHGGLILLPVSPPKSRKERQKKRSSSDEGRSFNTHVDKIKVANSITEMVITHWRDVVRHLKNIGALKVVAGHKSLVFRAPKRPFLRPSASDTFALRKPPDWDDKTPVRRGEGSDSPTPIRRVSGNVEARSGANSESQQDSLIVRKQRSRARPMSSQMLSAQKSMRSILSPTAEERSSEHSPIGAGNQSKSQEKSPDQDSSSKTENTLPPPPPPFPLTRTPIDHSQSRKSKETSKFQEKSGETAHSGSSHHKKGKLSKTPKSHDKKHKDRSKASERSTESRRSATEDQGLGKGESPRRSIEIPTKDGGIDYSAQKALAAEEVYFHSPMRRVVKPQDSNLKTLQPQNPNIRVTKASDIVPEGTVSAQLRRIAASEPGQQPGLRVPGYRRLSKTTHVEPIQKNAWAHIQKVVNDPLSRISYQEDEESLAALAKAMESEEISIQDHVKPVKKDALTRVSQEDDQATLSALAHAMESEEKNANKKDHLSRVSHEEDLASLAALARALDSQESSTGSDDLPKGPDPRPKDQISSVSGNRDTRGPPPAPFHIQMTAVNGSVIPMPVGRSHDLQKHSNSPSPTRKSPFKIPEATQPIGDAADKTTVRPRGSSVKALAAKFNNPEPTKTPTSSPTRSPAKSSALNRQGDESPRRKSLVAPYTRNTPSPVKSQKSGKLEKTPQSARTKKPVERQIQFDSKQPTTEPRLSFAKSESPRRILKSSLNDSTPLRHVGRSVESMRSSGSFTVNATNPFSVPLKPVKGIESNIGPTASPYDGPSSTPSSRKTLSVSDPAPEAPQDEFSQSTTSNATERTMVNRRPVSPLRDVLGISPNVLMPNPGSTPIPVLGRSPSVLHSQITTLQSQISKKNEQLRQLRQQLEARSNHDVGTLSEQLSETKKELQMWKTRAEAAERQVERLSRAQSVSRSASTSRNVRQRSVDYSSHMQRSSTDYEDGSKNIERIRKTLHGMDGAASSEFTSEESNHTVIRDIRSAMTGSEYSIWREQTMDALGSTYLPELE